MEKQILLEKIGELSHKRFMSGNENGGDRRQDEIVKILKQKSGELFAAKKDEQANFYRNIADEISKIKFDKDSSYSRTGDLYEEIENAIEANYSVNEQVSV